MNKGEPSFLLAEHYRNVTSSRSHFEGCHFAFRNQGRKSTVGGKSLAALRRRPNHNDPHV
jgi:hypothetical protein